LSGPFPVPVDDEGSGPGEIAGEGSDKGDEMVRGTTAETAGKTMGEEMHEGEGGNLVVGDKMGETTSETTVGTTGKGNGDDIAGKGNSDKITGKGNSDDIMGKGNGDDIGGEGNGPGGDETVGATTGKVKGRDDEEDEIIGEGSSMEVDDGVNTPDSVGEPFVNFSFFGCITDLEGDLERLSSVRDALVSALILTSSESPPSSRLTNSSLLDFLLRNHDE
jgi:hypothetical protein